MLLALMGCALEPRLDRSTLRGPRGGVLVLGGRMSSAILAVEGTSARTSLRRSRSIRAVVAIP
jgi:hypothetical protein